MNQSIFKRIATFLGFNRDSEYVKKYLREANIRSGVFMAAIIVILEIWLILRQTRKYLIPLWGSAANKFEFVFSYTSNFFLFLFVGITVMLFCITFSRKGMKKKTLLLINVIPSGLTILYSFFIFLETKLSFRAWTSFSNSIGNVLLIAIYFFAFATAAIVLTFTLLRFFKNYYSPSLINLMMVVFAAMCISFGVKVSYSDYLSQNPKEIICFLTMVIYGACLLIWKPYISFSVNLVLFLLFYFMITNGSLASANGLFAKITGLDPNTITYTKIANDSYTGFTVGQTFSLADWNNYLISFKDGDLVNYITFFISFTMICISIYHQRRSDAIKDEELEYLANYDELTNLNNYSHFIREVQAIEDKSDMRVLFINIDNFKTYNDQRGFNEGNEFLKRVGQLIKDQFEGCYVCRQSNDHYIAFANENNLEATILDLNDKVKALDEKILPEIKVGYYKPLNEEDMRRAVDKARYACSTIKDDHTKTYAEYDKKMHDAYHLMQYVIHNVDAAINNGWIRPYYQPVVWSNDGKMCGVEALARWMDPKRGMLPPGNFIPTLENTKLIHKLDACIIERVCQDLHDALSINDGTPIVPISINFSRLDFELMDVVSHLEEMMNKYNIPKELIHVEITESALNDSDQSLTKSIHTLKEKGYALWLDDFGSGYSSLNVLKDFEFDVLKIDMKFLKGFSTNPRTKPLIESVIQMAEKLGMRTLTEGVENKEEMDFLNKVHCERLQGYLFGKPMPHEELKAKISSKEIIVSKDLW